MGTRRVRISGALLLLGALLLACGGGTTEPSTPASTESGTAASDATSEISPTRVATPFPMATDDGPLTGAPVPALDRVAAELDEDRLNLEGGTFPPLVDPAVIPAGASLLDDDALVLGAVQNGEARAYPLSMMTFHHVANDLLGGEPYLVTF